MFDDNDTYNGGNEACEDDFESWRRLGLATPNLADQHCCNCRFFRGRRCIIADEFDCPSDNGGDWCERWELKGQ